MVHRAPDSGRRGLSRWVGLLVMALVVTALCALAVLAALTLGVLILNAVLTWIW